MICTRQLKLTAESLHTEGMNRRKEFLFQGNVALERFKGIRISRFLSRWIKILCVRQIDTVYFVFNRKLQRYVIKSSINHFLLCDFILLHSHCLAPTKRCILLGLDIFVEHDGLGLTATLFLIKSIKNVIYALWIKTIIHI